MIVIYCNTAVGGRPAARSPSPATPPLCGAKGLLSEKTLWPRNRAPAVLELEAAIDKALSSAFGYGTPAYLRYNAAAVLDPSPILTNVTARAPVSPSSGGPMRRDAKVQETRQQYSVNKSRAIALLQNAIRALEEEIRDAQSEVGLPQKSEAAPLIASDEPAEVPPTAEVPSPRSPRASSGFVGALRHHFGRWWRGRSR